MLVAIASYKLQPAALAASLPLSAARAPNGASARMLGRYGLASPYRALGAKSPCSHAATVLRRLHGRRSKHQAGDHAKPAALRSAALMRSCQPGPSSWK